MNALKRDIQSRPAPESPARTKRRAALAALVDAVAADARVAPHAYLADTRVPGGGE